MLQPPYSLLAFGSQKTPCSIIGIPFCHYLDQIKTYSLRFVGHFIHFETHVNY